MLGYKDIVEKLASYGRPEFREHSVANPLDNFKKILEQLRPAPIRALEIGTRFGISSAILASLCEHVYTVDVRRSDAETTIVWGLFNVRHKITYRVYKNRDEIREAIKTFDYDFVFIDSLHDYENVKADYEIVKDCKSILFHDAHMEGVEKFMNEIGAQKLAELAYLGECKIKGTFIWKDRKDVYE